MSDARTIWKYPLEIGEDFIQVPDGGQFLTIQIQGKDICAWFLVDPNARNLVPRKFILVGTGQPFDPFDMQYQATVQDGAYVWHVFEVKR